MDIRADEISKIIRDQIGSYAVDVDVAEVGTIVSIGDGIARIHGVANAGLLTGDNSINGDAPIVVMTTEVLRNMIYEDSPQLDGLRYVVLDEVHYLQDRYRGAVWEEILIHLPVDVQIVSLSATPSSMKRSKLRFGL